LNTQRHAAEREEQPAMRIRKSKLKSTFRQTERERHACLSLMMADGRPVWFDGDGWSMFPVFRPGVKVRVAPWTGSLKVGQVAVFVKGDSLVAHRLLDWDEGRQRWLAKGDTLHWFDGPVLDEHLVGVVDLVSRRGREKAVKPDLALARFSMKLGYAWRGRLDTLPGFIKHLIYLAVFFTGLGWLRITGKGRGYIQDQKA